MSNSIPPLKMVKLLDSRINVDYERQYAIIMGGQSVTFKQYTTTSYSTGSFNFTCPPPSLNTFVDRQVYLKTPNTTLSITGYGATGVPIIQTGCDAFRSNPLAKVLNNVTATVNNTQSIIQLQDCISALERAYNYPKELEYLTSLVPNAPDESQQYSDLFGSLRNPLNWYGNSIHGYTPRGAYPMTITGATAPGGTNTATATVVADLLTPLYLSPFLWNTEGPGLYNVQTMDFQFNFWNNLGYMWSHSESGGITLTNISVNFPQPPLLLFTYIMPKDSMPVPRNHLVYPFYNIVRLATGPFPLAAQASQVAASSVINISNIPKRIYIFARQQNLDLTWTSTDTFAAITNISIQFGNYTNLMATASQEQLWRMSVNHGLALSWPQFSGKPMANINGGAADSTSYCGGVGSVIILEPGIDFGLTDLEASGLNEKLTLQVYATITNPNVPGGPSINYSLYVLTVTDGVFSIPAPGASQTQIGVITSQDIINLDHIPHADYSVMSGFNIGDPLGGNKFTDFVKNKAWPFIKKYGPQVVKALLPLFGAGAPVGGAHVGGAHVGGDHYNMYSQGGAHVGGHKDARYVHFEEPDDMDDEEIRRRLMER